MPGFWERLLGRRNQGSAQTAKERLQLVLVTDRADLTPEQLQEMKEEILAVISKYVKIARDKVEINLEQRQRDNWLVADIPLLRGTTKKLQDDDSDDA
ncbi:MAG TPA: cell division topological specificity factor MinE [Aggregatilineales bacterium]|nr:cell division topological specificity factor MinE [Anaerolineales bacterium]HRE48304.1 cell division topological specificity factor MinE [Aggregatilineales bacterium]